MDTGWPPAEAGAQDAVGWPDRMPPFGVPQDYIAAAMAAPGGMVLVERTPGTEIGANRYDIIDGGGNLHRTFTLGSAKRIVGFGRASVFVVTADEWGLLRLTRHPWPEPD
jgi:hypothetical protein